MIIAPWKFDVLKLKQIFAEKLSFEGKYASLKSIKFPRGKYLIDSSDRDINTLLSLLFISKFSSARQLKLLSAFFDESR